MTSNTTLSVVTWLADEQNISVPFLSIIAVTLSERVVMPLLEDVSIKKPIFRNLLRYACVPGVSSTTQ